MVIEDGQEWWSDRLEFFSASGYDVTGMGEELRSHPEMASKRLERFEELIGIAENLRQQLLRLPGHWEVARNDWLQLLDDPRHAIAVENEFKRMQLSMRPWGLEADAYRSEWENAGQIEKLDAAINRLDSLDVSLALEASQVCSTIANTVNGDGLLGEVGQLEEKQRKRVANLREMAELLEGRGFSVGSVFEGGLAAAAERLGVLADRADRHQHIADLIVENVTPFDAELAGDFIARRREIQRLRSDDEEKHLRQLESEIHAVSDSFRRRLSRLQEQVDRWQKNGYSMPIEGAIPAEDLLIWETRMLEIERAIKACDSTWERIEMRLETWPDKRKEANDLKGDLQRIEDMVALADEMDEMTKTVEGEGQALMDWWSDYGFSMALWRHRFDDCPRIALEEFRTYVPRLEEVKRIIDGIELLDTSMGGASTALTHTTALRDAVLEEENIVSARGWLEARRRRNLRHRVMLEHEWEKLVTSGKADENKNVDDLKLTEFEALITATGLAGKSPLPIASSLGEGAATRLIEQVFQLLEEWGGMGWDTLTLRDIAEGDSMAAGKLLPAIRIEMQRHQQLRQRLEILPLERSDEILTRVELDIRKPERLEALWKDLPRIAAALANLPPVENEKHWRSWTPQQVQRPVLLPHTLPSKGIGQMPDNSELEVLEATILAMTEGDYPKQEEEVDVIDEVVPKLDPVSKPEIVIPPAEIVIDDEKEIESSEKNVQPVVETKRESVNIVVNMNPIVEDQTKVKNAPEVLVNASLEWGGFADAVSELLSLLGIEGNDGFSLPKDLPQLRRTLSPHVGIIPRDTRVDRLLRLSLRSIPTAEDSQDIVDNSTILISKLAAAAERLGIWTKERMQFRGLKTCGKLLPDSLVLGVALERIPGPGVAIPLIVDDISLARINEYEILLQQVENLRGVAILPSAGNIASASA